MHMIQDRMAVSLGLRAPWMIFVEEVKALFGEDRDIAIEYDDASKRLTLRVSTMMKADAMSRLMETEYHFGTVSVRVFVVPANTAGNTLPKDASSADVLSAAFDGNPVVTQVRAVSKGLFRDLCYCVFRKEVVQIPADNIGDINGNESTLFEDIATEVFTKTCGVYFCTSAGRDGENALDKPLGEWP